MISNQAWTVAVPIIVWIGVLLYVMHVDRKVAAATRALEDNDL